MPSDCPMCREALEELVQEIHNMTTRNQLAPNVAAKMEHEIQVAITELKKDAADLRLVLGKLGGAKTLLAGVASASGLLPSFAETMALVKSHMP